MESDSGQYSGLFSWGGLQLTWDDFMINCGVGNVSHRVVIFSH